jgi:tetratricopeptide (TPR) repeat protein
VTGAAEAARRTAVAAQEHQARGDHTASRRLAHDAVRIAERDPAAATVLVEALVVLGQIHEELSEQPSAERAFERAVSAARELPRATENDTLRVAALVALGNARRVSGRYQDAEPPLREALAFGTRRSATATSRSPELSTSLR